MATNNLLDDIDWDKVQEIAVEEAAKAFGSAVGGAAGAMLVDALFGKKDDENAFNEQVLKELHQIDKKIVEVLAILHGFPNVVRIIVHEELVKELALKVAARADTVGSYFPVTRSNHDIALTAAQNLFEDADHVARDGGVQYYNSIVGAWAVFLAAMNRLIRLKTADRQVLTLRAVQLLKLISPWLDPELPTSIIKQIATLNAELITAQKNLDNTKHGHYLFYIRGPFLLPELDPNVMWHAGDIWFTLDEGRGEAGWQRDKPRRIVLPKGQTPNIVDFSSGNLPKLDPIPWWNGGTLPDWPLNGPDMGSRFFAEIIGQIELFHNNRMHLPEKIKQLQKIVDDLIPRKEVLL